MQVTWSRLKISLVSRYFKVCCLPASKGFQWALGLIWSRFVDIVMAVIFFCVDAEAMFFPRARRQSQRPLKGVGFSIVICSIYLLSSLKSASMNYLWPSSKKSNYLKCHICSGGLRDIFRITQSSLDEFNSVCLVNVSHK